MIVYIPNMGSYMQALSPHVAQERREQVQEDPFDGAFRFQVLSERFGAALQAAVYFFSDHYQSVCCGCCSSFLRMNKGGLSHFLASHLSLQVEDFAGFVKVLESHTVFIVQELRSV